MAATSLKVNRRPKVVTGSGAPANGDTLCVQTTKYPKGTIYAATGGATYVRVAVAGVAADFQTI